MLSSAISFRMYRVNQLHVRCFLPRSPSTSDTSERARAIITSRARLAANFVGRRASPFPRNRAITRCPSLGYLLANKSVCLWDRRAVVQRQRPPCRGLRYYCIKIPLNRTTSTQRWHDPFGRTGAQSVVLKICIAYELMTCKSMSVSGKGQIFSPEKIGHKY